MITPLVFSMIRKNKTALRPSLFSKGTLSSIPTVKLANDNPARRFEPIEDLLKTAKSATYNKKQNTTKSNHLIRNKLR